MNALNSEFKNKIFNCDCSELINKMNSSQCKVDLILTSPPYNILRPNTDDRGYDMYNDGMTNEQYSSWICSLFSKFDSVLSENGCILWNMSYGSENTECMSLTVADILRKTNFTLADIIVWKKDSAWPNDMSPNKLTRICEFVYVFCRRNEFMTFSANKSVSSRRAGSNQAVYNNVFNFIEAKNNDGGCALNKATFSTDFVKKLLNIYAKPNSFVFDPFMGTGTTAVACHQLGHSFIGSEISAAQCDFASNRIFDASNQISLFDVGDAL